MIEFFVPAKFFIIDIFAYHSIEVFLTFFAIVSVCCIFRGIIVNASRLELEHLLFEPVEVYESKESVDHLFVLSLILLEVVLEVHVETKDLVSAVCLLQFGINHLLQNVDVVLEYGSVSELVFVVIREHLLV